MAVGHARRLRTRRTASRAREGAAVGPVPEARTKLRAPGTVVLPLSPLRPKASFAFLIREDSRTNNQRER